MNTTKYGWDYFDKFFCISLRQREDRRQCAATQFSAVGLNHMVEYHLVDQHPDHSEQGIFESHLSCIKKGLASGASSITIFEDDVLFHGFDARRLNQAIHYIERNSRWDALFLGCLVTKSRPTSCAAVRRVKYRSLAHAYALSRPFAEKLAAIHWSGTPYDAVLRDCLRQPYAIYPSIAFQSNARSDNRRLKGLDRFRRLCGGLQFIQMMNERYHRYFKAIVLIHLALMLAIIGWLMH